MSPRERQAAIESGAMLPEDFIPTSSAPTPAPKTYDNRPSSAQQDLAKSLGITVEELQRRQALQFQQLQQRRQNKAGGGALTRLAEHLAGPASHVRTFTAEDFPELLDTLARYGKARALPPKNSTIFGEMIKNASEDGSKALTHVTLSADGTPQAAAQTDSDYLAYLVNLAGGKGAGTQALSHLQDTHPTLTAYPTHDAQGYWDKIIQRQPGWEKVPGTDVDVDSLKWSRQSKAEGGVLTQDEARHNLKSGALNSLQRFFSALPEAASHWPKEAWDMVRMPADLVMGGSPEQKKFDREQAPLRQGDIRPMLDTVGADRFPSNSPEAAANQVTSFLNPVANAVFSPVKHATLGAEAIARAMQSESPLAQMLTAAVRPMGIMKQKGGNWLTGSVEDALKVLKREGPYDNYPGIRATEEAANPYLVAERLKTEGLNSWIDKALTKYVRNDMATPEDPIRALAEKGILHVDPDALATRLPVSAVRNNHIKGDTPVYTTANSDFASKWERAADANLRVHDARSLANTETVGGKDPGPTYTRKDPWLKGIDPKALVHQIPNSNGASLQSDLGFEHLIDELQNAINPESGLPTHLQFPADRLSKVTVPQAVERVSQINAWRAAQKAEADQARANNAAMHLHKEYPNDPKGMRWVQLKSPEAVDYPGYSVIPGTFKDQTVYKVQGPDGSTLSLSYNSPEEAQAYLSKVAGYNQLKDALKYEGDTMGHCVGGYCDDVARGRSNIFSLRDAKGQPHVTIEAEPPQLQNLNRVKLERAFGEDAAADIYDKFIRSGTNDLDAFVQEQGAMPLSRIVQIKGKGNAKPHDDYLPYVQDFVKSQPWSDVGDLENSGLFRLNPHTTQPSAAKLYPNQTLFTEEELAKIAEADKASGVNYAEGGPIVAPNQVDFENLDNFLKPRYN